MSAIDLSQHDDEVKPLNAATMRESVLPDKSGEIVTGTSNTCGHLPRSSHLGFRAALVLLMTTVGAGKFAKDLSPVEQPQVTSQTTQFVSMGESSFPSPNDDEESVMENLGSHAANGKFLKDNIESTMPAFPFAFLNTYRPHPSTILKSRKAACNGRANWNAERLARRGVKSYTVSVCPANPFRALWNAWHQVQVVCIRRGERYLIFDNNDHVYGDGTLSECMARLHPDMAIVPILGGSVPWKRTTETAIGGLSIHAHLNMNEHEMQEYPELEDRGILDGTIALLR